MGFFNSLKNVAVRGVSAIGKAKNTVDKGLQMYDKAKHFYSQIKQVAGDIGGDRARAAIAQREAAAQAAFKKKTGVSVQDINKAAGVTRQVSNETGNVLGLVGNVIR